MFHSANIKSVFLDINIDVYFLILWSKEIFLKFCPNYE